MSSASDPHTPCTRHALVSAYIPTHDRPVLLRRALESVMRQTYPALEVIVVDDASSADVSAVIASCAGPYPVILLRNEVVQGAPAARNAAMRVARGTWMAGLDDDDEWLPDRIRVLVTLAEETQATLVAAADWLVHSNGSRVQRTPPPVIGPETILRRNAVGNQALFSRQAGLDIGGFDETLQAAQDHDFWIRMIIRYGIAHTSGQPLQYIHLGGEGITSSARRHRGYWRVYRKHRAHMSREVAAIHLYGLHKASGKRLSWSQARFFFVRCNRMRVLSRLISERLPALEHALQALASLTRRWRG